MKALLALLLLVSTAIAAESPAKLKVLLITGGHAFEPQFYEVFKSNASIALTTAEHAKTGGATAYERDDLLQQDVVVLYDMPMTVTDKQKSAFLSLFEKGIGVVVLHHALVSFPDWPDYERIIGGHYPKPPNGQPQVTDAVGYQHDLDVPVVVVDKGHPITTGLQDFTIHDEIYWGFHVGKDVHPLLTTSHPKSGKPLAWTRREGKSRLAYLQLGHDHKAWENPNYPVLVDRCMQWVAGK